MVPCGIAWYPGVLHGTQWYCVVLSGIAWYSVVLRGTLWYCMVLSGIAWYPVVLHGITRYSVVLHVMVTIVLYIGVTGSFGTGCITGTSNKYIIIYWGPC